MAAVHIPTSYTYSFVKPAQVVSNNGTPTVMLGKNWVSLLKSFKFNKHISLKIASKQNRQPLRNSRVIESASPSVKSKSVCFGERAVIFSGERQGNKLPSYGTHTRIPIQLRWHKVLARRGIHQHLHCLPWSADDCFRLRNCAGWCYYQESSRKGSWEEKIPKAHRPGLLLLVSFPMLRREREKICPKPGVNRHQKLV